MYTIAISNLPPMPRNRSHMLTVAGKRPMNIKTPLCREFEKDLTDRLIEYKDMFTCIQDEFDKKRHYISATYYIYTPASELFTKEGAISSRSIDTDAHKCMRDVLYSSIGLDDKVERDTRFYTPVSATGDWDYLIRLEIKDKESLYV